MRKTCKIRVAGTQEIITSQNKLIAPKLRFRLNKIRLLLTETPSNDSTIVLPLAGSRFWTARQIATNLIILALASVAGYLQYYLYPLIMSRPLNSLAGLGFGETNNSLKFSILTFQYTATRCMGTSCARLVGIPAFDFFQVMIIILIFANVLHFINTRKK